MSLPPAFPLSMSQIAAELGVPIGSISLLDPRVRTLAGVPSGPISFSDLLGKSSININLQNITQNGDLSVRIAFSNNGRVTSSAPPAGNIASMWAGGTISSATASGYEIFLTFVSGPNPSSGTTTGGGANASGSAYGVWLNLGNEVSRTITARAGTISGEGFGTLVFDAAIRKVGTTTTLASCRVSISAQI